MRDAVTAAVEYHRLLHELNPEESSDYLVRALIDLDEVGCAVEVSFNVRVRTRAAP